MPPAAYFFLACQKKVCKKETLGYEIALSRLKRHFDSAYHSPMARPVRNALRAGRTISAEMTFCAVNI